MVMSSSDMSLIENAIDWHDKELKKWIDIFSDCRKAHKNSCLQCKNAGQCTESLIIGLNQRLGGFL